MLRVSLLLFAFNLMNYVTFAQQCNGGAVCIAFESCTGLYVQLQQGPTPELTQLLRTLHCGFQNYNQPKICCPPSYMTRFGGSNSANSNSANSNPTSLLPDTSVCGDQDEVRIVGGTVADIDEHTWMVLLRYDKPRGFGFYCGGVLISKRYVMTAAHCVRGADLPRSWRLSQVRLGEYNTSSNVDCVGEDCNDPPVDVPVEEIIAHEAYDPADDDQHNDIALIRLARDVRFTPFIKPICLPVRRNERDSSFEGYDMDVAGWGKTEARSESDVKLKVKVPVVSLKECSRVFRPVGRRIISKQLCAGGAAGRDSCRGDSGGALMGKTADNKNWLAVGIVSYGPSPCGTAGWPGVYTRVGAYMDWILSKLRP